MKDAIVPAQSRAGRALVNWSREKLAEVGGVPTRTMADFELGNTAPRTSTVAAIRAALEAAGVEFTNGDLPGVRLMSTRFFLDWGPATGGIAPNGRGETPYEQPFPLLELARAEARRRWLEFPGRQPRIRNSAGITVVSYEDLRSENDLDNA